MSWAKVLVGFAIMAAVFIVWYRLMRSIRGEVGSGIDLSVTKKARKAEPANELERIIAAHRAGLADVAGTPPPSADSMPSPAAAQAVLSGQATAPPPAAAPAAPVLLAGAHKLAYLVFKAGLPDHPLFARVRLGECLPAGTIDEALGSHAFTLVVCRPDFTIAAVIDVADPDTAQRVALVRRTLESTAIRHIVLEPRNMPRPKDVRALIHGA